MEHQQKDQVRPVSVDGIQEFDNRLPAWWVGLFYLTIVFGLLYGAYKYVLGGETLIEAYNKDYVNLTADQGVSAAAEPSPGEAQAPSAPFAERAKDAGMIAAGKAVFATYCTPCHGADGGGVIGPNLTDHYFLHGNSPDEILKVVSDGVVEKGMAAWKPTLGPAKVEEVTAYVLSLIGTTPQNPKAPQGEQR